MLKEYQSEEFYYDIETKDLANDLSISDQDAFPEVFATSRMIALMELASARLMKTEFQANELSVGVAVNVKHLAATPNGEQVKASATFVGKEGKLYKFRVEVHDRGGIIGSGEHSRVIVQRERLVNGAVERVK